MVTNDEDFLDLISTKGFPPEIVLLKTGNQSGDYIEALLLRHKADIRLSYKSVDYGVLELF